MKPAPSGRQDGRFRIELPEPLHDSIRIDYRVAAGKGQGRDHDLAGSRQQLAAVDVIDLDRFEIETFVLQDLSDLGAKWTGVELVELKLHRGPRSGKHVRHRGGIHDPEVAIAIVEYHVGPLHAAKLFEPVRPLGQLTF